MVTITERWPGIATQHHHTEVEDGATEAATTTIAITEEMSRIRTLLTNIVLTLPAVRRYSDTRLQ